jgi:hypothetical protein
MNIEKRGEKSLRNVKDIIKQNEIELGHLFEIGWNKIFDINHNLYTNNNTEIINTNHNKNKIIMKKIENLILSKIIHSRSLGVVFKDFVQLKTSRFSRKKKTGSACSVTLREGLKNMVIIYYLLLLLKLSLLIIIIIIFIITIK